MDPELKNLVQTRIPTRHGEFTLHYYSSNIDDKEHIAFVKGDISGVKNVPVRIHSECFTGDVLGSRRCDCGEQLDMALQLINEAGYGVLIYLRQEGRGIGLLKKLQAYNLQDQGMDTVDANIHLGHLPDERDYSVAALILNDLNIDSIRLLTNNPRKIDELKRLGIHVQERVAIEPDYHHDNIIYLKAKAEKMSHLLSFANDRDGPLSKDLRFIWPFIQQLGLKKNQSDKPFVTLNVNKIDASIVENTDTLKPLPDDSVLNLKHALRAHHDAVLVGINTVLAEDPKLNVLGYDQNSDPQPVILDNQLSFPEHAALLRASTKRPIIYTSKKALADNRDGKVSRLMQLGVRFITADEISVGQIDLTTVLASLAGLNIKTLLVEDSGELMAEFLNQALANYCIVTMPAKITGGLEAVEVLCQPVFKASNYDYQELISATIVYGAL